ncbi:hypothetical protein WKS79_004233 [Providencia stuartii]
MNLEKIYHYKLNKLFNFRALSLDDDDLTFTSVNNELEEYLSLYIEGEKPLLLSWWCNLFDFEKLDDILSENTYERYDLFLCFLKSLPLIFLINKSESYKNENLKITHTINQLKTIKKITLILNLEDDNYKTEIFNYLSHLIGVTELNSNFFLVKDNNLFFKLKFNEWVNVKELISSIHSLATTMASDENKINLKKVKNFQIATIDFIMNDKQKVNFPYDDFYLNYAYPDIFINNYLNENKEIFSILIDCADENQSECNFFISDMIYMNYIYYILKDNPKEILKLKRYCKKNNKLFFRIIAKIINLNYHIDESDFKGLKLEYYLLNNKKIIVGYAT